ncbi:unnamed protein product, partial [Durusdinium trenchii]
NRDLLADEVRLLQCRLSWRLAATGGLGIGISSQRLGCRRDLRGAQPSLGRILQPQLPCHRGGFGGHRVRGGTRRDVGQGEVAEDDSGDAE